MHPVVRRDAGHERGRERHGAGYPGGKAPKLPERAPEGVHGDAVEHGARARAPRYVSRLRRAAEGTGEHDPAPRRDRPPAAGPVRAGRRLTEISTHTSARRDCAGEHRRF